MATQRPSGEMAGLATRRTFQRSSTVSGCGASARTTGVVRTSARTGTQRRPAMPDLETVRIPVTNFSVWRGVRFSARRWTLAAPGCYHERYRFRRADGPPAPRNFHTMTTTRFRLAAVLIAAAGLALSGLTGRAADESNAA